MKKLNANNIGTLKLGTFLLLLTWILLPVQPTSAANLFRWDADQLSTTSLGPIITVQGGTSIDTNVKHGGLGSMRLVFPGNTQGQVGIEPGPGIVLTPGQRYFHRWWMKFDSNFHWRTGGGFSTFKMNRIKRQGDILPGILTQHLEPGFISVSECEQCDPAGTGGDNATGINYNFDPQSNRALLNWNEYIVEFKLNSASDVRDGEYALWVNGVQIGRASGISFCCSSGSFQPIEAWGMTMVRPFAQIQGLASDGGIIWVDDFSNDTTFNSTIGSNNNDLTPPAAPGGLRVQ
ncbi:MAG: hypothetical protein ABL983_01140 [Nitrospira sp.]